MLSQPKNRVQAIKSKFENLSSETATLRQPTQLFRLKNEYERKEDKENANSAVEYNNISCASEAECSGTRDDRTPPPNRSYLYKSDVKRSVSEPKPTLTRQSSDPGKKLHRSHAFRCEKTQKVSPKRHVSCSSRPEIKMDKKLSKERLKRLGDLLDERIKKENFTVGETKGVGVNFKTVGLVKDVTPNLELGVKEVDSNLGSLEVKEVGLNSVPNENVPPHILAQYAQVIKPKKKDENDIMTDSGVSSETENLDEDKGRVKKISNSFEKTDNTNLDVMEDLAGSSETMKLERKNPHLILTDTLKKALKQPLPRGPPPKKPPRTFIPTIPEHEKKDAKRKLEKLEQVLLKREAKKDSNIYDIAEENLSQKRPKEVHYLCTEILDITQRTLLPNQDESPLKNCFNKLNCGITYNSMSSLPYTRLSSGFNACGCSNENLNKVLLNGKCVKCQNNDEKHGFKCHLDCECRVKNSEFYIDEHIYDEPCVSDDGKIKGRSKYGTLNKVNGAFSKSLEELRVMDKEEAVIYEEPRDQSSPDASPKTSKTDFQKLLHNFENGHAKTAPRLSKSPSKLSIKTLDDLKFRTPEHLSPDKEESSKNEIIPKLEKMHTEVRFAKKAERKYGTEVKRYKPGVTVGYSLPRKNPQLDVDRENLNALMNEIYETVTAACNMEENKPGSFPTDQSDGSTSDESVKLTRSLTEKRKNYVRRVSSRLAYLEPKNIKTTRFRHQTSICSYKSDITAATNPYSTFRSWKSFRASQNNLPKMDTDSKYNLTDSTGNILSMKHDFDSDDSIDNISIDEKAGCVDIELPFEPRENGLFNVCLLVGLNYMTGKAYVKSVFPSQVQVPQHIENLIFPETLGQDKAETGEWTAAAKDTQCYSFILTDERGERSYGYCRRVLPEGATTCLPLCYCIIGRYRAPGFYYKVLQEIESHHGGSEAEMLNILQQLLESDFPNPGEEITLTIETYVDNDKCTDNCTSPNAKCSEKCKSDALSGKTDALFGKCDALSGKSDAKSDLDIDINGKCMDMCRSDKCQTLPDMRISEKYFDPENNNSMRQLMLSLNGIRIKTITRPLEPRAEETSSCALLDSLGAGLLVKVFGSLLLERKLIVRADKLSSLSSILEALQSSLYPFVWQQPLISCVPAEIQRAVVDAPLPVLAGTLDPLSTDADSESEADSLEEGMFIDVSHPSKVVCYQGDEATILPTTSYKTLKTSLQMESIKNKERDDTRARNVMISEAFLRFFVDILGDFWRYFRRADLAHPTVTFDKDAFIKSATSKQNQYFLEWFTETAMFNHFIQNMAVRSECNDSENTTLVDTPTPNFYQLFEERINSRRNRTNVDRSGYKNALHKRVKLLKARLKDLVG